MTEDEIEMELSEEELEALGFEQEDIDEVTDLSEEVVQLIESFEEDIDTKLSELNSSDLYEQLGIEVNIELQHSFSVEERDD